MKVLIAMLVLLGSSAAFAENPDLRGKSFCRTVKSVGPFDHAPGLFFHCISFTNDNKVADNGNEYFYNRYEKVDFDTRAEDSVYRITFESDGIRSEYILTSDAETLITITGSAIPGTEFKLSK